ncbi:MAG: hypothetical protein ACI9FJ_000871 [Alteromonadaceae bacterium]|jgi:hypothetical protein
MGNDYFAIEKYNIKLEGNEEREYNCHYTIWYDKNEPIDIRFIRFTESAQINILNKLDDVELTINIRQVISDSERVVTQDVKLNQNETVEATQGLANITTAGKISIRIVS